MEKKKQEMGGKTLSNLCAPKHFVTERMTCNFFPPLSCLFSSLCPYRALISVEDFIMEEMNRLCATSEVILHTKGVNFNWIQKN